MIKVCPYCRETLPFWNIVYQRLFPGRQNQIRCPHCTSVISDSSGAKLPILVGGSSGLGFFMGALVAELGGAYLTSILIGVAVLLVAILVGAYLFAPTRSG
jgi:ribosomal protein S27E